MNYSKTRNLQKKNFATIPNDFEIPSLLEFQLKSFKEFQEIGAKRIFNDVFPISDYSNEEFKLEFVDLFFEEPKMSVEEVIEKNGLYTSSLRAIFRLTNLKTKEKKEQEIYCGEIPILTESGTFIIDGNERVLISQLLKSPGIIFTTRFSPHLSTNATTCNITPERGAWLELNTESTGIITTKIDRKKKVPFTVILKAFGVKDNDEIKQIFQSKDTGIVSFIEKTLEKDPTADSREAILEIYRKMKPREPLAYDNALNYFNNTFRRFDRYNLNRIGRYKINQRLGFKELSSEELEKRENKMLQLTDLIEAVKVLISMNNDPNAKSDVVDHLGNRRVKPNGKLMEGKLYQALVQTKRQIQDRMAILDAATLTAAQLISPKVITATFVSFFKISPLSQVVNQVNVLSELSHKRKLTSTGPGGIKLKTKSGAEIRDVHPSHYGRICPINTPEGQNVGLVLSLTLYSRLNEFGFIETPYYKVKKSKITNEIVWLNALDEEKYIIARGDIERDKNNKIVPEYVESRYNGDPVLKHSSEVELIDVASDQLLSETTALVPFVQHDEAHRALMATSMQKQALPCINIEKPYVATGLEHQVAKYSGRIIIAQNNGKVEEIDARHIVINIGKGNKETYKLDTFKRTNEKTYLLHKPLVKKGDTVKKGDILADNSTTEDGQLALGNNIRIAFMPWYGYTFEDACIISEKMLKEDKFTSIYTERFSVEQKETRLGKEELTNDIPNVSEKQLANLDEEGIIIEGAEVEPKDILVGKVSPKGEADLSPEEKLMKAIFGKESKDIKDTSLKLENGKKGRVIHTKILTRKNGDKLKVGVIKKILIEIAQLRKLKTGDKLAGRHGNKSIIALIAPEENMPFTKDGKPVDMIISSLSIPSRMNVGQVYESQLGILAKEKGFQAITPGFNNVSAEYIKEELKKLNLGIDDTGKVDLYDGITGDKFDEKVLVGIKYLMKLNHMVDDKIHARSVGPYGLITQQPLKGRVNEGGQKLGEMEVWALEAYGAAKTLQESLTTRSDDVVSRSLAYSAILKGETIKPPVLPAAFDVVLNEFKGLCLNVNINYIKDCRKN